MQPQWGVPEHQWYLSTSPESRNPTTVIFNPSKTFCNVGLRQFRPDPISFDLSYTEILTNLLNPLTVNWMKDPSINVTILQEVDKSMPFTSSFYLNGKAFSRVQVCVYLSVAGLLSLPITLHLFFGKMSLYWEYRSTFSRSNQ